MGRPKRRHPRLPRGLPLLLVELLSLRRQLVIGEQPGAVELLELAGERRAEQFRLRERHQVKQVVAPVVERAVGKQ